MSYLTSLVIIPLIFSIVLSLFSEKKKIKTFGLAFSILIFLLTFTLWFIFDLDNYNFQFSETIQSDFFLQESIKLTFGIDGVSLFFLILSTLLIPISILANYKSIYRSSKIYFVLIFLLTFCLIGVFSCLNLLFFFFFFETIVPLMYLLIGIFGSRLEKLKAARYFFIYTILGSVFMLLGILKIYRNFNTINYSDLFLIELDLNFQKIIWTLFFLAFGSKVPLVPFHIWLPLARVEASITGSVLLAGILLKLGTYGFFRFSLALLPAATLYFTPLIYTLSLISLFYAGLSTVRQTDFKRLIAYSSISRMAIVCLGLFSLNFYAIIGSFVLMVARAFSSSGLFIIITDIYNRHRSRTIKYFRGLAVQMPIFSICFLLLTLANISFPGSMNFLGEVLIFLGLFQNFKLITLVTNSSVILSATYSLFLFNRIVFGKRSIYLQNINRDLTRPEFYNILPLLACCYMLGLNTNFLQLLEIPIIKILYCYL